MPDRLGRYRAKRTLAATPEPAGAAAPAGEVAQAPDGAPRFVVQEHHASSLHWDLRLEHEGVLRSWAVPKGIPPDPRTNHLAIRTEDHPLEYLEFAGEIPAGQYGAGTMAIWDHGTFVAEKFRDDEVIASFRGERMRGRYALFQTRGDQWMLHRMDPPEDPGREAMPAGLRPMLATAGDLPRDDEGWAYEVKWDGIRALAYVEGGRVRLETRTGADVTRRYPELRSLGAALGAIPAVLDGEIVAFDDAGRPDFQRLQGRMHVEGDAAIRRAMAAAPAAYMIFDLLYLDGHSTCPLPWRERRRLLEALGLEGPAWKTPAVHRGSGAEFAAATRARALEGIVAKRIDAPYEPGRRSRAWIKIKHVCRQEFVIGGWMPGAGRRAAGIGSLLVGYHDDDGALRYAGSVGTGFTDAELRRLEEALAPLRRDASPFTGRQPRRGAVFAAPRLVAEVEFSEWTRAGTLRQPSYKGRRDDKDPADVVREPVTAA